MSTIVGRVRSCYFRGVMVYSRVAKLIGIALLVTLAGQLAAVAGAALGKGNHNGMSQEQLYEMQVLAYYIRYQQQQPQPPQPFIPPPEKKPTPPPPPDKPEVGPQGP
jgi:hypothetical protein